MVFSLLPSARKVRSRDWVIRSMLTLRTLIFGLLAMSQLAQLERYTVDTSPQLSGVSLLVGLPGFEPGTS
jgi:hypothetical protein